MQDFALYYPTKRYPERKLEEGHFCVVIQSLHPDTIYYYDSYGFLPDAPKNLQAPELYDRKAGRDFIHRLIQTGKKHDYNPHRH